MQSAKILFRSLRVIEHLISGATIALGVAGGRKLGLQLRWVPDVVRWWHARLCRALGLRIEVRGALVPSALLVANHVSWLDIPVLGSLGRIDFLAKTEVGGWPLIGWMARVAGTLFIARGGNQAMSRTKGGSTPSCTWPWMRMVCRSESLSRKVPPRIATRLAPSSKD